MVEVSRVEAALVTALFAVLLVSCGGGSSSSNTVAPTPPSPPPPIFVEISSSSGIAFEVNFSESAVGDPEVPLFAGGVAAGDYDADGDIDLFIVRGDVGPNLLYRNDGDNVFADVAATAGLAYTKSATENFRHSGPTFADIDGDGDLDLFVGGIQGDPSKLFANNGDGTFSDVTAGSGLDLMGAMETISAAFGDYDLDGDLDLLLAHWGTDRSRVNPGDTEHLWRNDSTGSDIRFTSVSIEAGISPSIMTLPDPLVSTLNRDHTFSPSFVRLDDDAYPDIVIASDFNSSMVFMSNGDGSFTNATDVNVLTDTNGMGSALGDYDSDGDLDWFVTSIYRESTEDGVAFGNRLYRNDNGIFVDVTDEAGVADGGWGWAACFLDLDNDGDLDIYHTNGWPIRLGGDYKTDPSRAFVSDGTGRFEDAATRLGLFDTGQGRGVVCSDFDNDGDTDVFLWSSDPVDGAKLFRNDSNANNYLAVKLNGLPPNTEAAGARIIATIGATTQTREITIGSNFISQNPAAQVIGLGTASQVDSLIVEWPGGQVTDLGIAQANRHLVVDHPDL